MTSESLNFMARVNKLHVAMFPWLAFGHIIPYLELSKFIAQKGHKITFISTPRNIDRLPKIPPNFASSITFLKLPIPKVDELPPGAEATMDIKNDHHPYLKKAFDGLQHELIRFLENSLPDYIIYDFAAYLVPPAAARLGIPKLMFTITNAWFPAFLGSPDMLINNQDPRTKPEDFMVPPEWVPFETKVAYKQHEINWILDSKKNNAAGVRDSYRTGMSIQGADAILYRHCNEFEGQWLELLEEVRQQRAIPLGLMPPQEDDSCHDRMESWTSIKQWLDTQKEGSVVYVAFGSEVSLSQAHITELALGLESSGVPFFWVLRKQFGSSEFDSIELPDEFEKRVKGRGVVWRSWAPQLKILKHESVGGFLTHCGWSSTIEGLMHGHPFIMLPFVVDQGLNARVLEDREVGVEVPRNEPDGSFTRNSVADSVRMVMIENDGKKFRQKAKEIGLIFGNRQLHNRYLNEFVEYLEKSISKS